MSEPQPGPTYDLSAIKALVGGGRYFVTGKALNCLGALGFDGTDVVQCVMNLSAASFYKTMPAIKVPGLWQDVYRPDYGGIALYVKLQITQPSATGALAVVVSFKRK